MKNKIQIELSKEQFSRLQYMQSMYMQLLLQFKFQIPNYAKAQEKATEMDRFLMELRMKFDETDDILKAKKIVDAEVKTLEMAEDIVEGMTDENSS